MNVSPSVAQFVHQANEAKAKAEKSAAAQIARDAGRWIKANPGKTAAGAVGFVAYVGVAAVISAKTADLGQEILSWF